MSTFTEPDPYCLVVRKPLRYRVAYVGRWPDVLGQIAQQKAEGADVARMRVIRFHPDRQANQAEARRAFAPVMPEHVACPECAAPASRSDIEGACVCVQGHLSWYAATPEWKAILGRPQEPAIKVPRYRGWIRGNVGVRGLPAVIDRGVGTA